MKPNDYDGDKKADIVYITSGPTGGAWMQVGNPTPLWAGMRTDVNVGGDYDNDGKWEPAELSGRAWYSSKLASPVHYDPPGLPTAPADLPSGPSTAAYDGDGKADPATYDPTTGVIEAWIGGVTTTLATLPTSLAVVPALTYVVRTNIVRLSFFDSCLSHNPVPACVTA